VALENDELDEQTHLAKPAEKPDEKDDWDWYANQPEQKTATHSLSPPSLLTAQANVASGFEFHPPQPSAYRSMETLVMMPNLYASRPTTGELVARERSAGCLDSAALR